MSQKIYCESNFKVIKQSQHCRERWMFHLNNKLCYDQWTPEEDVRILTFRKKSASFIRLAAHFDNIRSAKSLKKRLNLLLWKEDPDGTLGEQAAIEKGLERLRKTIEER